MANYLLAEDLQRALHTFQSGFPIYNLFIAMIDLFLLLFGCIDTLLRRRKKSSVCCVVAAVVVLVGSDLLSRHTCFFISMQIWGNRLRYALQGNSDSLKYA